MVYKAHTGTKKNKKAGPYLREFTWFGPQVAISSDIHVNEPKSLFLYYYTWNHIKSLNSRIVSDNYTIRNKENVPNLLGVNLLIFHCSPELFRRYHAVFVHVKFLKYGKHKKTD